VKHQSLAQAAEIFRLVTSDKVKRAYERNVKMGKRWGRLPVLFDVVEAVRLRDQGFGFREVARLLLEGGFVQPTKEGGRVRLSYQTVRRVLARVGQNRVIVEQGETGEGVLTGEGVQKP
jgi:DNA invertase Pin-like site-specific DNA recombinase